MGVALDQSSENAERAQHERVHICVVSIGGELRKESAHKVIEIHE